MSGTIINFEYCVFLFKSGKAVFFDGLDINKIRKREDKENFKKGNLSIIGSSGFWMHNFFISKDQKCKIDNPIGIF